MIKLLTLSNFCPNGNTRCKVIDILCSNKGLFFPSAAHKICDIYNDMECNVNKYLATAPKVKIYPLNQEDLNCIINRDKLGCGTLSCGHDLPVWINDPEKAKYRIMVLSQDPRRNKKEMGSMEIGISSPFGLHSIYWRSSKRTGMIHQMAQCVIDRYGEDVCFYYTDILKLRKTDSKEMDNKNMETYKDILAKEIKLFNPTIILLLGKIAQNVYNSMNCYCKAHIIELPHPNARIINGKWGNYPSTGKCDTEWKIKIISGEIEKYLK